MAKRIISIVVIACMVVGMFLSMASAMDSDSKELKDFEIEHVKKTMHLKNLVGESITIDVLHDNDYNPSYLLGFSEQGFVIIDRESGTLLEYGKCNPYKNFEFCVKYYAGPLNYYVVFDNELNEGMCYYDIIDRTFVDCVGSPVMTRRLNNVYAAESTDSSTIKVSMGYTQIQRKAFGLNTDNTCSAIALGIALNYITTTHGIPLVNSGFQSEYLNSGQPSGNTIDFMETNYPKAHSLHRYLVDVCGMGNSLIGIYGTRLKEGFDTYISNNVSSQYDVRMRWTLAPLVSTIESNIDSDFPVLISTTVVTSSACHDADGPRSGHTMVVYGYEHNLYDSDMLLIHTGHYWDSDTVPINSDSNRVYHQEHWIDSGFAAYGYYISINQ